MLPFLRLPRFAPSLLLLALAALGCDSADVDLDHGGGTSRDLPLAAPAGSVFGPCIHDEGNAYHWCSPPPSGGSPVVCSIPQEQGKPPASVCLERRAAGECPDVKGFYSEFGDVIEQPIVQDYALACALECEADLDCPQFPKAMICVAHTCAWENLQ